KNSSKSFQSTKQSLHLIALFIKLPIIFPRRNPIAFRWHNRLHAKIKYELPSLITFVSLIHNDFSSLPATIFHGFQQLPAFGSITRIARGKRKCHCSSIVCSNHVNFCCSSRPRLTNRLWTVFFNAPVPSGCTFTAVLSNETAST